MKKVVVYPIEVLDGDFCADYKTGSFCQYFDNHHGQSCDIGFSGLDENEFGCLKPDQCKNLLSINEFKKGK